MSDQRGGPTNLAAIDLGTNSVHLVVARVAFGAQFEVLAREKEMVRLGSAGGLIFFFLKDMAFRKARSIFMIFLQQNYFF
jgi:exopolyphosphatase/pppGpp-phosphohydrolase